MESVLSSTPRAGVTVHLLRVDRGQPARNDPLDGVLIAEPGN